MDEQILARHFVDDTEALRISFIGTCEAVEHKNFLVLQVCEHFCTDRIEFLSCNRHVDLAPRDIVMYGGGVDNEFIVRLLPVYFPVFTTSAPVSESVPSPLASAFSTNAGTERLRSTVPFPAIPRSTVLSLS